jgi:hypothetical protein
VQDGGAERDYPLCTQPQLSKYKWATDWAAHLYWCPGRECPLRDVLVLMSYAYVRWTSYPNRPGSIPDA